MQAPFVIFGLPRSRTKWLSAWLSQASGCRVGHDLAAEVDTIDEYFTTLTTTHIGTVETGAIDGWRLMRRALPSARFVVVFRPLEDVRAELLSLGIAAPPGQLEERESAMHDLCAQPGVLGVTFASLATPQMCAAIHRHCLPGIRFDYALWERADRTNVQIDFGQRVLDLTARAPKIAALKLDAQTRLETGTPWVRVTEEPWRTCAEECRELGARHHAEASVHAGPGEMDGTFELNDAAFASLGPSLRCVTARVDSRLAGYCLWTIERNIEAVATSAAVQGPFFVTPELARLALGQKLMAESKAMFAQDGVLFLRLHHTLAGRGMRAGSLYRRMGAIETKREYTLRVAG